MGFLKRIWKDRRGNALIIAGAALPVVIGGAGLATDTVQWVLWKRELQRAADSAAFAGVYAEAENIETVNSAVTADLAKNNNHTGISLNAGYPVIAYPADTSSYSKAVQVTLAIKRPLGFSSLFLASSPTITASGTAAMVPSGSYCVVALNSTSDPSINVGGSSSINMGCGAISNSTSPTNSVDPNGNAYTFAASPVASVGGMPSSLNGATDLQPFHMAMPDPYAGKYSTDDSSMNCNMQVNGNNTSLTPGCYKSFHLSGNKTYNLAAGTYYLDSTDFTVDGGVTVIGTGVTIILTGSSPGSVSTNGNSTIELTAPTTGSYADMLFIGTGTSSSTINGTNNSYYDGAMYFPNSTVNFTGTSGQMTQCAMVVADYVDFSGNSNIQNSLTHPDGSACQAATQVTGKSIRLVA